MNAVRVEHLRIETADGKPVVDDVSLTLHDGELLGLCGESGAGKTTAALALLGHVRRGLRHVTGQAWVGDTDMLMADRRRVRAVRAHAVGYVAQGTGGGLNPAFRVRRLLAETARHSRGAQRQRDVSAALRAAKVGEELLDRYPHQLSGGQQQRVAIAMALIGNRRTLILDEPTTGLDATTQAEVLDAIDRIRHEHGIAALVISHDVALVAQRTDRIAIMRTGRVLEQGSTSATLARPRHEYTRELLAALPKRTPRRACLDGRGHDGPLVLAVEAVRASHRTAGRSVVAAHDITFTVDAGRCLALVGESGSGKTTIARVIAGLHRPDAGRVVFAGQPLAPDVRARARAEQRVIQLVSQDPGETLNPRQSVRVAVERPLSLLRGLSGSKRRWRTDALLERVGLTAAHGERLPRELSGGERQRVAIARAMAADPAVLVCDEITSALDATTQARLAALLDDLRRGTGLAILLITHDLAQAGVLADHMVVLENGLCRDRGATSTILERPSHPYTQRLIASAPALQPLPTQRKGPSHARSGRDAGPDAGRPS